MKTNDKKMICYILGYEINGVYMFYSLRITIIILFSLLSWSVQAQQSGKFDEDEVDCEKETTMTTVDLRYCGGVFYEKADKELNEVYQQLLAAYEKDLAEARERGHEEGGLDYIQEPLKYLRQSQRDWIKFRDSFCDYKASQFLGGTAAPVVYMDCLTSMTQEQTKRLRASLQ